MSPNLCSNCQSALASKTDLRSPLSHLLGTNSYPADDAEIRLARKAVEDAELHLHWLGQEIERLRALLDQRSREYENTSKYAEEHRALLTPARRLIPELWGEIFSLSIVKPPLFTQIPSTFDVKQPPFVLLRVCRTWRTIALSTPRLWSTIGFSVSQKKPEHQTALVKYWLEKSGVCPLSIYLLDGTTTAHPAIEELIVHCQRWASLHISLPLMANVEEIWSKFAPIKGNLPCLRKLSISRQYTRTDTPLDIFEVAPQLTVFECGFGTRTSGISLPWIQLTTLSPLESTIGDFIEILRLCPNLTEVDVSCSNWDQSNPPPTRIEHSHLRVLRFSIDNEPPSSPDASEPRLEFFEDLTLPAIRVLELRHFSRWPQLEFISFLSRSSQSLHSFTLDAVKIPGSDLVQCLRQIPLLNHLELHETATSSSPMLTDDLLDELTFKRTTRFNTVPCLAPKLQSIIVHGQGPFRETTFADMVESRWRLNKWRSIRINRELVRLRSAELVLHHEANAEAVTQLERLRDEGLQVKVQAYTMGGCYRSVW